MGHWIERINTRFTQYFEAMSVTRYRFSWTSKYPIGFNGGNNWYAYVDNDPINLLDVTGLSVMTIIYKDGSKDRFQSPTIKALTDSLQKAANTGNLVDRLYIEGHGDEKDQYLYGGGVVGAITGNSEWLEVENGRIISGSTGDDLTELFLKGLNSDALVALNGCETGRGQDSVAEQMSKLLPNRVVAGGQGLWQAGWLVGSSVSIGEKNYFINGQKAHSAW